MIQRQKIVAYKSELGYSDNDDNFALAQATTVKGWVIGSFSALANKMYVVSFEESGILFIEVSNFTYKPKGNNFLVPKDEIINITLRKQYWYGTRAAFNAWNLTIETADDKSISLMTYSYLLGMKWVTENFKNIKERLF